MRAQSLCVSSLFVIAPSPVRLYLFRMLCRQNASLTTFVTRLCGTGNSGFVIAHCLSAGHCVHAACASLPFASMRAHPRPPRAPSWSHSPSCASLIGMP